MVNATLVFSMLRSCSGEGKPKSTILGTRRGNGALMTERYNRWSWTSMRGYIRKTLMSPGMNPDGYSRNWSEIAFGGWIEMLLHKMWRVWYHGLELIKHRDQMAYQPPSCRNILKWVGQSITEFVQGVFWTGQVPVCMNRSLICLIPKTEQSENIAQFRPICLSNVVMKIVSKIISERLKPLMKDLVGLEQASFIPGRQTTDSIIVAQEMIHALR